MFLPVDKAKKIDDEQKIEVFEKMNKSLEQGTSLAREGDKYKYPAEELINNICDKFKYEDELPPNHNKGLIKMWKKYKRLIGNLNSENISLIKDIQNSKFIKPENNRNTEDEIDKIK